MPRKLKVGIIGVGGIAASHIPGWRASEHAELVAGSDLAEPVLQKWGKEQGITRLTRNPADLFADPDIDIIDICTPNNFHAPLAIAAMRAGKHVICEKPLSPKPAQIRQMIAARNKSRKLLMTAQHFRFGTSARAMKAELDTGVLGDIYHARSWMLRRAAGSTRPGFILKKLSGGGPCIDIGVHILDLTLWMMGHPKPVSVTGVAPTKLAKQRGAFLIWGGGKIPPELDIEDFAAAFVRFANGATLILEVSWMLHHDTASEDMQMWLYGTKAGSHWPSCQLLSTNYQTDQFYNRTLKNIPGLMEPHALECVEFARAVAEGRPSPVPPEDALPLMAILDGIYRSHKTGREVRLKV